MFKFMAQYWAATSYPSESQYDLSGRSIPSNYWSEIYRDVILDLDEASTLVSEEEFTPDEEKTVKQAQIEVVKVMGYHQLVTVFGDIPYTEALDSDNVSPAYDTQEDIYSDLMDRLDSAINDLNTAVNADTPGFSDVSDLFYAGNIEGWVKFANSLKMRMAIQLSDVQPSVAEAAINEASPNAFQSNNDNLALQFSSTPPNRNPVWEDVINTGRNDFVAANTLIDMMNNFNDPRRAIQFTKVDTTSDDIDNPQYQGGLYGSSNDYIDFSHIKGPLIENDFEGMLLEYAEVEFIRAEAAARNWTVAGLLTAEQHYNNAITADMEYWSNASSDTSITPNQIADYLTIDASYPVAGSEQDQLKAIAEQKWLGLYMQGLQAWTDWRRLDHPTWYYADNPAVDSEDEIPTRFVYPVDEQNLNQSNWETASQSIGGDEKTTLLFWDADYASSVN
jgi:hypothetical protein